jgi:OFA family oxalate/formate antiporter-like MFS transporter
VPYSTTLAAAQGWNTVFIVAAALNVAAALMALVVLKPLRSSYIKQSGAIQPALAE